MKQTVLLLCLCSGCTKKSKKESDHEGDSGKNNSQTGG